MCMNVLFVVFLWELFYFVCTCLNCLPFYVDECLTLHDFDYLILNILSFFICMYMCVFLGYALSSGFSVSVYIHLIIFKCWLYYLEFFSVFLPYSLCVCIFSVLFCMDILYLYVYECISFRICMKIIYLYELYMYMNQLFVAFDVFTCIHCVRMNLLFATFVCDLFTCIFCMCMNAFFMCIRIYSLVMCIISLYSMYVYECLLHVCMNLHSNMSSLFVFFVCVWIYSSCVWIHVFIVCVWIYSFLPF